jgi:hypothetical protein
VNPDEAKTILLLYRPGTADADDPQIAGALGLAKQDPQLDHWLTEYCARQETLRAGFRQIAVPAGLKEQIISEQIAQERRNISRRQNVLLAAVAIVVALVVLTPLWFQHRETTETFATYRTRMASLALRGPYRMDLVSADPVAVRAYLAQNHAPADYRLPAVLEKTAVVGCAIENWRGTKVAMICFRTGRPLPPDQASDLWLFVIDRSVVKGAPRAEARQFAQVSRLGTMTWTEGDKLYVLGMAGDEAALRQYL